MARILEQILGEKIEEKGLSLSPKKWFSFIKKLFFKFLRERTSPFERALGLSLGVFVAFLPIFGIQSLLLLSFALLIPRVNRIALLFGFEAVKLVPFPIYLWAEWRVGSAFMFSPPLRDITHLKDVPKFLPPLFIGGLVIGTTLAIFIYWLTYFVLKLTSPPFEGEIESG